MAYHRADFHLADMPAPRTTLPIPNPLIEREPELVERLDHFRHRTNDLLLDKLAAAVVKDPAFPAQRCLHSLEDITAAAQIFRILTKDSWDRHDFTLFDAFWRNAIRSDAFADEFEAERHRIQHHVESARREFVALDRGKV